MLPPRKKQRRGRRGSIDIYFVLYLTAVVLLLGTTPLMKDADVLDLENAIVGLLDAEFEISVEKVGLYVPVQGVESVSLNTPIVGDTVNQITAHGTYESVQFRVLGVVDTISNDESAHENGVLVRTSDSTAQFLWKSERATQPAVYIVQVEGVAQPLIPRSIDDPQLRSRIRAVVEERGLLRDTARFTVNVVNMDDVLLAMRAEPAPGIGGSIDTSGAQAERLATLLNLLQNSSGQRNAFSAFVRNQNTFARSDGTWTQEIVFAGQRASEIELRSASDVHITGREEGRLRISGTAPVQGRKTVDLTLVAQNGDQVKLDFEVQAVSPNRTLLPTTIMAGNTYDFDLTRPEFSPGRLKVSILENGTDKGTGISPRFSYTPDNSSGTGEIKLYVDGVEIESHRFTIGPVPKPKLHTISNDREFVVVEATSFGRVSSRVNKGIVKVFRGQEVEDPVLLSEEFNPTTLVTTQRWRIRRLSGSRSSFTLSVYDQRGPSYRDTLAISAIGGEG